MKKYTFEAFVDLGAEFKTIERTGQYLFIKLSHIFGTTKCDELNGVLKDMGTVKSRLDDIVCTEFPSKTDHEVINVFYGNSDIEVKILQCIPKYIKHRDLTLSQYKQIIYELRVFMKDYNNLSMKTMEMYSKTFARPMLNHLNGFMHIRGNLQLAAQEDLHKLGCADKELDELDSIFWGDVEFINKYL